MYRVPLGGKVSYCYMYTLQKVKWCLSVCLSVCLAVPCVKRKADWALKWIASKTVSPLTTMPQLVCNCINCVLSFNLRQLLENVWSPLLQLKAFFSQGLLPPSSGWKRGELIQQYIMLTWYKNRPSQMLSNTKHLNGTPPSRIQKMWRGGGNWEFEEGEGGVMHI